MCLDRLKKIPIRGRIGWKVFDKKTRLSFESPIYNDVRYVVGRWYEAESNPIQTDCSPGKYLSGFHIYLNRDDAESASYHATGIRRVQFSGILATGEDDVADVVVAKRMKILPLRRRK